LSFRADRSALACVLVVVAAVSAGCGAGAAAAPDPSTAAPDPSTSALSTSTPAPGTSTATPFRFFAPTSFWNQPLAAAAPLDPSSAELMQALNATISAEEQAGVGGPWIDTSSYSVPIYTVPADEPTVRVELVDHSAEPTLQSAWNAVPLPANAQPARGSDAHLVVWQPSTDRLWEFWRLVHEPGGWQASWGGAMRHASLQSGAYGRGSWPGAKPWWGGSASSLSIAGGLITLEDLQAGTINHALAMSVPETRAGIYASPARRSDGKSPNPLALPEGAHLRLNPNLNLAALHLPHLALMIAEAAQRYGIFIRDRASIVAFYAQDPTPTGTNPFTGPGGYFENELPSRLLASFPWKALQLLKMELHPVTVGGRHKAARTHRSTLRHAAGA
jgi:hypothetical protein